MFKKLLLLVVGLLVVGGIVAYPKLKQLQVVTPAYQVPGQLVKLEQGWSEAQRTQFHHTAQGTRLVPYDWFLALEQPCFLGCEPFAKQEYLGRFGFLAGDSDSKLNPDGLPVGLARQTDFSDPVSGKTYAVVGLSCAACHTGELHYKNYAVRIEGGVAMMQPTEFQKALGIALVMTEMLPWRYSKFAEKVLGPKASDADRKQLKAEFGAFIEKAKSDLTKVQSRNIYPNDAGFGRTDALTRIGNQVFGGAMNNWDNWAQGNAPVRFPQVWDSSWFTWVQYNSSIADPLVRNIGEALGVRAAAKLYGPDAKEFKNSVNMNGLKTLEDLLCGPEPYAGLRSPKWPSVFPALDAAKVAQGATLYEEHCAGCHLPSIEKLKADLGSATPKYWVSNSSGKRFLDLLDVQVVDVGTDGRAALDFVARTADSGDLGKGRISAGVALELVTKGIRDQYFMRAGFSAEQKTEWMGYREENAEAVRSKPIYKARPLNGAWAIAPYLHNGSVPSLYEMLASKEQRGTPVFWLGNKQFDPVKVGYEQKEFEGGTRFDYSLPGNSNSGHWFQDGPRGRGVVGPALTDAKRWALVEYLKSL